MFGIGVFEVLIILLLVGGVLAVLALMLRAGRR